MWGGSDKDWDRVLWIMAIICGIVGICVWEFVWFIINHVHIGWL